MTSPAPAKPPAWRRALDHPWTRVFLRWGAALAAGLLALLSFFLFATEMLIQQMAYSDIFRVELPRFLSFPLGACLGSISV